MKVTKGSMRTVIVLVMMVTIIFSNSVMVFAEQTIKPPKYVFMFIGDGMGSAQRQLAQLYKQHQSGSKEVKLAMNTLDIFGINTTYSADKLVTDSAAAGTALATGVKTNNGVISKTPNGKDLLTLVEACEKKGIATGLVSSTRLTHATPAAFASHNVSRNNENEIAVDFLDSGVDFIAGGGNRHFVPQNWKWGKSKRKDNRNVLAEFNDLGYEVFESVDRTEDFLEYTPKKSDKVIATLAYSHMPYELDRISSKEGPSLAKMTKKGIKVLSTYDKGFFMMVEGGRIDHACHANDAAGAIYDTLAFDKAIEEALEFYKEHKEETLILVVGDHETGGMGLGFGMNYFLNIDKLSNIKVSIEDTLAYGKGVYEANSSREAYFRYLEEYCGLTNLTNEEKSEIESAMDMVDKGIEGEKFQYGYLTKTLVAPAVANILSKRIGIEWTTFAHSATSIPLSAKGMGAEFFTGYKDNTDIAKSMADLLQLKLN